MSAHVRALLVTLHPRQPAAPRVWGGLLMGAFGLLAGAWGLAGAEVGDRMFGALWLLWCGVGMVSFRKGGWSRLDREAAPLPLGRWQGSALEIAVYCWLLVVLALLPALGLAALADALHPDQAALPRMLPIALLLMLPLLLGLSVWEERRGPLSLLRIGLPWLPLGVAAPADWLGSAGGVLLTVAAMTAASGVLLLLRRSGWEAWWPRLPGPGRVGVRGRPGLAGPARLARELRSGLLESLAWGLGISALAWACLVLVALAHLPREGDLVGILLLSAAFLGAILRPLRIPLLAHVPTWRPPALPWLGLPLPHGAFARAWYLHEALVWVVLVAAQAGALLAGYRLLPSGAFSPSAVEITLLMLVFFMPCVVVWEGLFINRLRPAGLVARVALILAALGTAAVVVLAAGRGLGALELTAAMDGPAALHRLAVALGPAVGLGLGWLVVGYALGSRRSARG